MAATITQHEGYARIQLVGTLTILDALETREQLMHAFTTAKRAEIDLSDVVEVDCAGLQLLLSLARASVPVHFSGINAPLNELLNHFNLLPALGLKEPA